MGTDVVRNNRIWSSDLAEMRTLISGRRQSDLNPHAVGRLAKDGFCKRHGAETLDNFMRNYVDNSPLSIWCVVPARE